MCPCAFLSTAETKSNQSNQNRCRYDRQRCEPKAIRDMQLLAAMAPPGGGRSAFSPRIMAVFSPLNATQPGDGQLRRIFSAVLHTRLAEFNDEVGWVLGGRVAGGGCFGRCWSGG
jgi:hypothetical protein